MELEISSGENEDTLCFGWNNANIVEQCHLVELLRGISCFSKEEHG